MRRKLHRLSHTADYQLAVLSRIVFAWLAFLTIPQSILALTQLAIEYIDVKKPF